MAGFNYSWLEKTFLRKGEMFDLVYYNVRIQMIIIIIFYLISHGMVNNISWWKS